LRSFRLAERGAKTGPINFVSDGEQNTFGQIPPFARAAILTKNRVLENNTAEVILSLISSIKFNIGFVHNCYNVCMNKRQVIRTIIIRLLILYAVVEVVIPYSVGVFPVMYLLALLTAPLSYVLNLPLYVLKLVGLGEYVLRQVSDYGMPGPKGAGYLISIIFLVIVGYLIGSRKKDETVYS
jgi:hypothetical protein